MSIKNLIRRLKKLKEKAWDQEGWFRGGRFTPISQIKEYFTPTAKAGRNFWSTPAAKALATLQRITTPPGGWSAGIKRVKSQPLASYFLPTAIQYGQTGLPRPIEQFAAHTQSALSFGLLKPKLPKPKTTAEKIGAFSGELIGSIPAFTIGEAAVAPLATRLGALPKIGRAAEVGTKLLGGGAAGMALSTPGGVKVRIKTAKEQLSPSQLALSAPFFVLGIRNKAEQEEVKRLIGRAPRIVKMLKKRYPIHFNRILGTARYIDKEDINIFGKFAEEIGKSGRAAPKTTGPIVQRVLDELLPKELAASISNKEAAKLFDFIAELGHIKQKYGIGLSIKPIRGKGLTKRLAGQPEGLKPLGRYPKIGEEVVARFKAETGIGKSFINKFGEAMKVKILSTPKRFRTGAVMVQAETEAGQKVWLPISKHLEWFKSAGEAVERTVRKIPKELEPIKVPTRRMPSSIKGSGEAIKIKNHPEIYTDGILLVEDRTPQEVKKWQERLTPSYREPVEYSAVKKLYPKEKTRPVKFLGFEKQDYGPTVAHLDIGDKMTLPVNAEYYQWLKKEGYVIKSTGEPSKPLVLERNGKNVGLLMPLGKPRRPMENFEIVKAAEPEIKPKLKIKPQPKVKISGGAGVPPQAPPSETPPPISDDDLVKRLVQVLKKAKPLRGKQEALYTKTRGKKLARLLKAREKMAGEKGFYEELGALKGELPKVQFESIRQEFNQEAIDRLFNMIKKHPYLDEWEKINAQVGLAKILGERGGGLPTRGEIEKLNAVFGSEFTKALLEKRPIFQKLVDAGMQLYNLPRTLMAGLDLSATLLQNVMFAFRHPKTTAKNLVEQIKFFASEKRFRQAMEEIMQRPTYKAMKEAKLALTEMGSIMSKREEAFMASWAERIPGIGRLYRAGGRAYTGFLNRMRADVFDQLYNSAKETGVNVNDPRFLRTLGEFINNATGRGSLGRLERIAPILGQGLFSSRKLAATVNMVRPDVYIRMHPFVRKEALKTWLAFLGGGMTILGLAKLAGAEVGDDPTSADFGKIRIGNTRFNIWGTYQQLARLPVQLIKGYVTSSTSGKRIMLGEGYKPLTRADILSRFFEMKQHPTLSLMMAALRGQTVLGQPFQWGPEVMDRFIPMLLSDAYDLYQEHGPKGLLALIPAALGVGVQTYGKKMPVVEKTTKGKKTIKLRFYPRLADVLWSKLTGKPLTTVPKEQWEEISNVMAQKSNRKYLTQQANRLRQLVEEGKMTEEQARKEMFDIYSSLKIKPEGREISLEALTPLAISLGIDKYLGEAPTEPVAKAKWESGRFKAALKVYRDDSLDEESKNRLIEKLGQDPTDIAYYDIAVSNRPVRRAAVDEVIASAGDDRKELLGSLELLRREVNGKRILTDTIIRDLVKEGVLTQSEGNYLLSVSYRKDKKTGKYVRKTKKGKSKRVKVSLTEFKAPKTVTIKPIKISTSGLKVSVPKITTIAKPPEIKPLTTRRGFVRITGGTSNLDRLIRQGIRMPTVRIKFGGRV